MVFKKIGLGLAVVLALGSSAGHAATMTDLDQVSWAKDAIVTMQESGFINGYADGTFRPEKGITRAELVTILNRMNQFYLEEEIRFTDVESGDWYYKEVAKAVKSGAIKGYDDGTFKPNQFVTREQVAVILQNLYDFEIKTDRFEIEDLHELPIWAESSVKAILSNGIMSGYPDGTFRGSNGITRAEAAVVLNRVFEMKGPLTPVVEVPEEDSEESVAPIEKPVEASPPATHEPEGQVTEKLVSVSDKLESRVLAQMTSQKQIQLTELLISSIDAYVSNNTYDITSDVERAKSILATMTDTEKESFEDVVLYEIPLSELHELNQTFNLISY